jgi:hypothetical protein
VKLPPRYEFAKLARIKLTAGMEPLPHRLPLRRRTAARTARINAKLTIVDDVFVRRLIVQPLRSVS